MDICKDIRDIKWLMHINTLSQIERVRIARSIPKPDMKRLGRLGYIADALSTLLAMLKRPNPRV